eukprot:CFRG3245T1
MSTICQKVHVHLGAGKLGLGLALPALAKNSNHTVITIQRASKQFKDLAANAPCTAPLLINNENHGRFHVITTLPQLNEALVKQEKESKALKDTDESEGAQMILVLSEDASLLGHVAKIATSFSTSAGPGLNKLTKSVLTAGNLMSKKVSKDDRKILYACENDHDAIHALQEDIGEYVRVVAMLVDRICAGREVSVAKGVCVTTEPDEGVLVLMEALHAVDGEKVKMETPWDAADNVIYPESDDAAEFLFKRKWYLVNGTHTTLGFVTVAKEEACDHKGEPKNHDLIKFSEADEHNKNLIWTYCVARAMILLEEHRFKAICDGLHTTGELAIGRTGEVEVFNCLTEYAKSILNRMETIEDKTNRVFDGDIKESYEIRLLPVLEFMDGNKELNEISKRFLKHVGVSETAMRTDISQFNEDSTRFIN